MKQSDYDIVIVGGGMVGAAAALGFAKQHKKIAILETQLPQPFSFQQPPDIRISAISAGSIKLLDELGAWQHILAMRSKPLTGLSVWEDESARTDFRAQDLDQTYIGHMIENRIVQLGLHQALAEYDNVHWMSDAHMLDYIQAEQVALNLSNDQTLFAKLLVGADGGRSQVRQLANIGTNGWQYGQQALGIIIRLESESEGVTWQQFFPSGPRALLPMYANFASLVWYDSKETLDELKGLSIGKLKERIIAAFPDQLGAFEIEKLAAFPLQRLHADRYFCNRAVLAGDAAHCINPLAGQGVNLGFKDVRSLLEQIGKVGDLTDRGSLDKALSGYQRKRMPDNLLMMSAMDVFYKGFSNDIPPIKLLRNLGLKVANSSSLAKKQALRYAMGL